MSIILNLPPFEADSRGSKLKEYKVKPDTNGRTGEVLLVCCSTEVAMQIHMIGAGECSPATLSEKGARSWTHAYRFPAGVPLRLLDVLNLLGECVTLTGRADVNIGISVDWFKMEDDEGDLVPTEMGTCINHTKYAPFPNGSGSRLASRKLHYALDGLINRHPIYASTRFVTSPPGHKADGNSYGERLGRAIANKAGKTYIEMTAHGERPEQKEASERILGDEFSLSQNLDERILIIDDVFHTGATLDAAAKAARRAGANEVITLTAARTLRK